MKTKKKNLIVLFSLLILSSFILYSCYPDYGLTTTDYDTVITLYDKDANFKKPTYAMPDTVVHLVEEGTPEEDIDRSKDALILSTVVSNMTSLGYERVPVDTTAEAPGYVLLVGVTSAENYGVVSYPGWGYWGGWGWYGGYYPYYPGWGYTYTYSYTTGTIFMTMIDPDKRDDDNLVAAVWGARLNGVISNSSSINVSSRITTRINDAFNQSPYLGAITIGN